MQTRRIFIFAACIVIMGAAWYYYAFMNNSPYLVNSGDICKAENSNGQLVPIVRWYSTPTCPHCIWVRGTVDKVLAEYEANGSIIAHHWEISMDNATGAYGKDLLANGSYGLIPESELSAFNALGKGYVPTFVLGCKYYKVGNSFERQEDLVAEEAYLRKYIGKLIAESR